jgi:hypothetical protein
MSEKELQELTAVNLPARTVTPMDLIEKALALDTPIEKLEQLFALQVKWEENEAKKAFHEAMAAFKTESIDILKNKRVYYKPEGKAATEYNHAELGQIVNTVVPLLAKHGLSNGWELSQPEGKVKVTCTITHKMGFCKSTALESPPDTSGGKNSIQAISSAVSYLERYTFLAVTGLSSRDQDDDGRGFGKDKKADEVPRITEQQYFDFLALVADVKGEKQDAYIQKFNTYHKIGNPAELPAAKFAAAVKKLEEERRA